MKFAVSVIAAVVFCALPACAGERAFPVHLVRPGTVGEEKTLALSFTINAEMVVNARRAGEFQNNQSVQLRARTQILEVSDAGLITKVRLVVDKGSYSLKTGSEEPLKKGTVLIAQVGKSRRLGVGREGAPLSDEAARLLALALPWQNTLLSEKSDPLLFGSPNPQKAGDSWPLSPQVLGELLPKGTMLDHSILSGNMTLLNAVKYRGVPCLKIQIKMLIPHYSPSDTNTLAVIPSGFTITDAAFDSSTLAYFPIDQTKQPVQYTETIRASATALSKDKRSQATVASQVTREVEFLDASE